MIYFDHSSATFLEEAILNTYVELEKRNFANTDSLHSLGFENKKLQELARIKIAELLNVLPEEIIFTSGASESNSLAIVGFYNQYQNRGNHILVACGEHSSTKNALASLGAEIEELQLNEEGNIDLTLLQSKLRSDTILVCLSAIQNEFGSIRNYNEIGKFLKTKNIALFVDAVQLVGKELFDFSNVDLVSLSAHKMHGLKGSGLLIKKKHIQLHSIIFGGQQEFGLRGGTSPVAMQVAFAKTLRLAIEHQKQYATHVKLLNETLRRELSKLDNIVINSPATATDYILNFSSLTLPSQVMLNAFNQNQIYLSAISTCVTKRVAKSSVACLTQDETRLKGVLRVSFSYRNTLEEVHQFIKILKEILTKYSV